MNKIRFSNDYDKLPVGWPDSKALLIGCYPIKMGLLRLPEFKAFLAYDTKISKSEQFYELPKDPMQEVLILSFIHLETGRPFTTIRVSDPEKYDFYLRSLGCVFKLELIKS